jgi:hypothetical protein
MATFESVARTGWSRLPALRPLFYLFGRPLFLAVQQNSDANQKRAARTGILCLYLSPHGSEGKHKQPEINMPNRRANKKKSRYADAKTENGLEVQRAAACRAVQALYCESVPLWRTCA